MKKSIITSILLFVVIISLGYNIYNAKVQNSNFDLIDNNLETITILNKDFDIYLINILTYDNFDLIENKLKTFTTNFNQINNNQILKDIKDGKIKTILLDLRDSTKTKIDQIRKVKAYRAI